jgi:hypothetical protein
MSKKVVRRFFQIINCEVKKNVIKGTKKRKKPKGFPKPIKIKTSSRSE